MHIHFERVGFWWHGRLLHRPRCCDLWCSLRWGYWLLRVWRTPCTRRPAR